MAIRWFFVVLLFHVSQCRLSKGSWNLGDPLRKEQDAPADKWMGLIKVIFHRTGQVHWANNEQAALLFGCRNCLLVSYGLDRVRKQTWFYTAAHIQFFLATNQSHFLTQGAIRSNYVIIQTCVWSVTTYICFLLAQEATLNTMLLLLKTICKMRLFTRFHTSAGPKKLFIGQCNIYPSRSG